MNALELKHISKRYGDFCISDMNLALPQGCVMGLVGENGAGKSTTIRMLLDMVQPDSGEVIILGKPHGARESAVKEDIGVVLDESAFPGYLDARKVNRLMKLTFQNWDEAYFFGLMKRFSIPEEKRVSEYSRGMKMKLSIGAAMSHHPRLLLLDEATSGLDPVARDDILELFFEFTRREDHSILMSSHIVSDLEKLCDYVAFLHKGTLVECRSKDELLEAYGLVHGTAESLRELEPCIRGRKTGPYGVEALVERRMVPGGTQVHPVDLEELFIYLTKEAV